MTNTPHPKLIKRRDTVTAFCLGATYQLSQISAHVAGVHEADKRCYYC